MKKLSILVPAAAAGILLSVMVLAAPLHVAGKAPVSQAPDRAAAAPFIEAVGLADAFARPIRRRVARQNNRLVAV